MLHTIFKDFLFLPKMYLNSKYSNKENIEPKSNVVKVETKEQRNSLIHNSHILVLVYGAKWCFPCQVLSPKLDELSNEEIKNLTIAKEDIDLELDDYPSDINVVPTTLFFKDGKIYKELSFTGADIEKIRKTIKALQV